MHTHTYRYTIIHLHTTRVWVQGGGIRGWLRVSERKVPFTACSVISPDVENVG